MDRTTLLNMLRENRATFERLLAQISEKRMLEPMEKDQRSGKDIVAHTTGWEQRLLGWLQAAARGETPQVPETGATWDDLDRLNAQTYDQNRNRFLQEIMAESHRSFQQLLEQVQAFSDEELFEPHRFAWLDEEREGKALWERIVKGPGYCHYQDHFFDLLVRIDPQFRFIPDPAELTKYTGTYTYPPVGSLTFRVVDDCLMLRLSWQEQEISGLALDDTDITYENFGLVRFYVAEDGSVPALEWWKNIFTRTEA